MVTIWLELYKFQFIEWQTPTDLKKSVGVNFCLLRDNFHSSVGETCGLPRANTVRPYRVSGKIL